jgi:hypothetical protein
MRSTQRIAHVARRWRVLASRVALHVCSQFREQRNTRPHGGQRSHNVDTYAGSLLYMRTGPPENKPFLRGTPSGSRHNQSLVMTMGLSQNFVTLCGNGTFCLSKTHASARAHVPQTHPLVIQRRSPQITKRPMLRQRRDCNAGVPGGSRLGTEFFQADAPPV